MFSLNYQSGQPVYEQLYQKIIRMAAIGVFTAGEKLPSVRQLAQDLGVNPNTVQKAYRMLEHDGIICSLPGKGSFISPQKEALNQQNEKIKEELQKATKLAISFGFSKEEILEIVQSAILNEEGNHD